MSIKFLQGWVGFLKNLVGLIIIIGGAVAIAGDFRWVTNNKFDLASSDQTKALAQLEINQLDRQITFLRTKVRTNEATNSEKIILPELERQLRELKDKKATIE